MNAAPVDKTYPLCSLSTVFDWAKPRNRIFGQYVSGDKFDLKPSHLVMSTCTEHFHFAFK